MHLLLVASLPLVAIHLVTSSLLRCIRFVEIHPDMCMAELQLVGTAPNDFSRRASKVGTHDKSVSLAKRRNAKLAG